MSWNKHNAQAGVILIQKVLCFILFYFISLIFFSFQFIFGFISIFLLSLFLELSSFFGVVFIFEDFFVLSHSHQSTDKQTDWGGYRVALQLKNLILKLRFLALFLTLLLLLLVVVLCMWKCVLVAFKETEFRHICTTPSWLSCHIIKIKYIISSEKFHAGN